MKFESIIKAGCEEKVSAHVRENSDFLEALETFVLTEGKSEILFGYQKDRAVRLRPDTLVLIYTEGNLVYAMTDNGERFRIKARLYEMEKLLGENFIRLNKSTIANSRKIESFQVQFTGAVKAVFSNGESEYLSRRCYAAIKRRFHL